MFFLFILSNVENTDSFDFITEGATQIPMIRLFGFMLLFPLLVAAKPANEEAGEGDIPRFTILSDGLYRGGQPSNQGFQFLKEKGIKTIINLRAEDNTEAKTVQKLGMNYVQIPVEEVRPWSQLSPGAIAKYFELVNNPANYPIFFHCQRGADRTGAFAALYRIALQHWTPKKAYEEARNIGMRWYYTGLKQQIYDFHPPAPAELQPAIKAK
jgi:protein tyrosine/serine phosphatase